MHLQTINALAGMRAALDAPEVTQSEVFRKQVMEPLRPFWEPFLPFVPPAPGTDPGDPAMTAARTFSFYTPDLGVARGRAALDRFERVGSWSACVAAVERAWDTLAPDRHGVTLDTVLFSLALGNPDRLGEETGGYTGFGGRPGLVLVLAWPTDENLPRLPAATAHEIHHNVRFSIEPFIPDQASVGQYIVAEGLAEAFAAELYGEAALGPWVWTLSDEQVAALTPRYRDALETTGFDRIRGYVFGDSSAATIGYERVGLPDFAGYAMGYRVVRAYLNRTGTTAAEATYVPWREIIDRSGFFEGA